MKRYGTQEEAGPVMGKASKYWTMWDVMKPRKVNHWYGIETVQDFHYYQNLSFEKDTALQKMEERFGKEFRIDESLNSGKSYSNSLDIEYNKDVYLFGRYKGQAFGVVNDSSYQDWYWRQTMGTHKESPVLKEMMSGVYIEFDGETIHIDDLEKRAMKLFDEYYRRKEFIGKEGDEFEDFVRLRKNYSVDTYYGMMDIYEFVTPSGVLVYYKGSKNLDIEGDIVYILKGKIKHNSYYSNYHSKHVEETQIKYPKIVEAEKVINQK